jgi:hypothetical protein
LKKLLCALAALREIHFFITCGVPPKLRARNSHRQKIIPRRRGSGNNLHLLLFRSPSYNPGMEIVLPALAVAFAAFCVWLAVRIINRRDRWAKWTLAAVVGLPVLYVASFGPACWLRSHRLLPAKTGVLYKPMIWSSVETIPDILSRSNCSIALPTA